jgi:hypothetical protein
MHEAGLDADWTMNQPARIIETCRSGLTTTTITRTVSNSNHVLFDTSYNPVPI